MPFVTVPQAINILYSGGILIYPTETFFALGCDPASDKALQAIYYIKKRPAQKPLPVIVADVRNAHKWLYLSDCPSSLPKTFWPGPLTLLLKPRLRLARCLLNDQGKVAVRISSHGIAAELAKLSGGIIAATSANITNAQPVRNPSLLQQELLSRCEETGLEWGIVNGEITCHYEHPSTIVEPVWQNGQWHLRVLREGAIPANALTDSI